MADQPNSSNEASVPLLLSELVVLLSSEMIVNLILKENSQPKNQLQTSLNNDEFKARGMQFVLLLILLASYFLFFQVPYLIAAGLCLVILKLAILRCRWVKSKNKSKTLRYIHNGGLAVGGAGTPSNAEGVAFSVSFKSSTANDRGRYLSQSNTNEHMVTTRTGYSSPTSKPNVPVNPLYDAPPNMSSLATPSSPTKTIKTTTPLNTWSSASPYATNYPHTSSPLRSNLTASPKLYPQSCSPVTQLSPPGIYNTGSICFLISSIQCLSSVEGFASMLRISEYDKYRLLTETLIQVIKQTQDWRQGYIIPSPFLYSVSIINPHLVAPKVRGSQQTQQDAGEFILWLLDNLHSAYKQESKADKTEGHSQDEEKLRQLTEAKEELVDKIKDTDSRLPVCYSLFREISSIDNQILSIRDMSDVYRLFCGQVLEARECQKCKRMSFNLEYHTILPLPVPSSTDPLSLVDCFKLFVKVENLSNEQNMLMCSYCSQNMAEMGGALTLGKRLTALSIIPSRLIIQLMRYSFDNVQQTALKKRCPIDFPLSDLDLSPFTMETKVPPFTTPSDSCLYNLTGFCVHAGAQSTSYGHYIAYTKVKDGTWYQFSDHQVTMVKDIQAEIRSSFVSQNAYILFYTRK